eukprot:c19362_g1_i2.p1 GENE.c19362_g1_i2~~c19362_g1_i2.p1  ORF type:complete len:272 (-),score=41.44 c19362_g1_i2:965-1780(-)
MRAHPRILSPFLRTRPAQAAAGPSTKANMRSYALFVPSVITLGLGVWQLDRMRWKQSLVESREKSLAAEPTSVTSQKELVKLVESSDTYRVVELKGEWDHSKEIFVGPRTKPISRDQSDGSIQSGAVVVTALRLPDGSFALVNRGWLPSNQTKQNLNSTHHVAGPVSVRAILRQDTMESLSSFIPENDPVKGQWFRVDPPQIATAMGIPNPAAVPFFERVRGQDAPNEPFAKSSSQYAEFTLMPTGHAGYAATWLTLSAATAFLARRGLKR